MLEEVKHTWYVFSLLVRWPRGIRGDTPSLPMGSIAFGPMCGWSRADKPREVWHLISLWLIIEFEPTADLSHPQTKKDTYI